MLVFKDRRTRVMLSHVVPRKGVVHQHSTTQLFAGLKQLGYNEVIMKCDGEPALNSVQEEVKRRLEGTRRLQ